MARLIVCDVDGTLLKRGQNRIDDSITEYIKNIAKSGKTFALASGRCYSDLSELFEKVKNNIYFICLDGSAIVYKDHIIYKRQINKEIVDDIITKTKKIKDINTYIYKNKEDVYKISFTGDEVLLKLKPITSRYEGDIISVSCYVDRWYEIVSYGTSKGTALKYLADTLNIDMKDVAAIGDNYNDISMLKEITHSYAMPYAKPRVKDICKFEVHNIEDFLGGVLDGSI